MRRKEGEEAATRCVCGPGRSISVACRLMAVVAVTTQAICSHVAVMFVLHSALRYIITTQASSGEMPSAGGHETPEKKKGNLKKGCPKSGASVTEEGLRVTVGEYVYFSRSRGSEECTVEGKMELLLTKCLGVSMVQGELLTLSSMPTRAKSTAQSSRGRNLFQAAGTNMLSVCSRQDSNLLTPSSTGKTHWFRPSETRCPSLSGSSA